MLFSQEFNNPDHCNDLYISLCVPSFFRYTGSQKENEIRRLLVYKNLSKIVMLKVASRSFFAKLRNFTKDIKLFDEILFL